MFKSRYKTEAASQAFNDNLLVSEGTEMWINREQSLPSYISSIRKVTELHIIRRLWQPRWRTQAV